MAVHDGEIWMEGCVDREPPGPVFNTHSGTASAAEVAVLRADWKRRAALLRRLYLGTDDY